MEPNKIDNQIREKLNAREIQPSAQAWDRLDAMLTVSEEKKPKKGYGWFFVAASTILFFGLGFFLFNTNETTEINNSTPTVTTINEKIDSAETTKINQISDEKEQPVLVQNETNFSKTEKNKKSEVSKELIKGENVIIDDWIEYVKDRPFNDKRYYISNQKLKNLGWNIEVNFIEGLNDLVKVMILY